MSNEIQNILTSIGEVSGVVGSAVLTNDGMVVASQLGPGVLDDVVAGLSSFLISTTRRVLQDAGMEPFNRFVLNATHGKVVLVDIGEAYLIVLTDHLASVADGMAVIDRACEDLREAARIEV